MKKEFSIFIILAVLSSYSVSVYSAEQKSLSTSNFIPIDYYSDENKLTATCSGKKAGFAQNYVSIGINKLTVNKDDPLIKRIFNKNRRAFGVSNLRGEYRSQAISIAKVGNPIAIKGKNSSIDMGVEWGMLDRIPWVLKNASIEIKLGYTADSSVNSMIEAFSEVTSAIPDYTISSSLATGMAITTAIDKLLFGSDRAINLLNAKRDLPLFAGRLCEGHYAIFSAKTNEPYEKYYKGGVIWTGNDLEYNSKPINDVSYAVVSVRVSDKYYDSVENSLNDNSRSWAPKYREIQTSFFDLIWVSSQEQLAEIQGNIRKNLIQARTLLSADPNLIQKEVHEIHQYIIDDYINKLEIVASRINEAGEVTISSTETALTKLIGSTETTFSDESIGMAQLILLNPKQNLPAIEKGFDKALKNAIRETEFILSVK